MKIWLITLTIFSLIVAIFVGNLYCQGVPYDNNAAGFIVASLAVLVTVLIGWQIFNVITYEKRINEIERNIEMKAKYSDARVHFTQGLMLLQLSDIDEKQKRNYAVAYRNFFDSLRFYLESTKNVTAIDACLSNMNICLTSIKNKAAKFDVRVYVKCDKLYEIVLPLIRLEASDDYTQRLKTLNETRKSIETSKWEDETDIKMVTGEEAETFMARIMEVINRARKEEEVAKQNANKAPDSK